VLIEIGNEVDHVAFPHKIIRAPRCHELIELAQRRSVGKLKTPAGRFLVSASLLQPRSIAANVVAAADFLLPHGNNVNGPESRDQPSPDGIRLQLVLMRSSFGYRGQPIFYNEDDHFDFDKPENHMLAALEGYAGWGFFDYRRPREKFEDGFQSLPVDWSIGSQARLFRVAQGGNGSMSVVRVARIPACGERPFKEGRHWGWPRGPLMLPEQNWRVAAETPKSQSMTDTPRRRNPAPNTTAHLRHATANLRGHGREFGAASVARSHTWERPSREIPR
jgi:hypothetical protein